MRVARRSGTDVGACGSMSRAGAWKIQNDAGEHGGQALAERKRGSRNKGLRGGEGILALVSQRATQRLSEGCIT
jgi:hypothetical protein